MFISLTQQLFFYMSRPDWTCMCVVDLMMHFKQQQEVLPICLPYKLLAVNLVEFNL